MRCPVCGHPVTRVVYGEVVEEDGVLSRRRRRECKRGLCKHRWFTVEMDEVGAADDESPASPHEPR